MKVEVEDLSSVEKRVNIEIPAERVDDELEEQFKELQKNVQVRGFRRGKVPRHLLERLFTNEVREMVAQRLVSESIEPALARKNLKPVSQPVVDMAELVPGQDFKYTVHLEVEPEVELKEYEGLVVSHKDLQVTEEMVDGGIKNLLERHAVVKEPEEERPVKEGDLVTAKVEWALLEEEGEKEPKEEEMSFELWRDSWIPGLKDKLVGREKGQTVEFTAEIPEETSPDKEPPPRELAGKKVRFKVTIDDIKERIVPELNEEFVKETSRFETVEEYREEVRKMIAETLERDNRSRREEAALAALVEKNPVEIPPRLARETAKRMAASFLERIFRGAPPPEMVEEQTHAFIRTAIFELKAMYLLDAIARQEGLEPTEEEVEKEIERLAEGMRIPPEKLKKELKEENLEAIKKELRRGKALDFVISKATFTEKAPGEPENQEPKESKAETGAENESKAEKRE